MRIAFKPVAISCAASLVMVVAVLPLASARAADQQLAFTIPADDGYGIADCMQSRSECGRVMANSFCEAHGHLKAVAYGSADDVTGSVAGQAQPVRATAGEVMIRCAD